MPKKITWFTDGGFDNARKRGGVYAIVNDIGFERIQKIIVISSNQAEYFGMIETLQLINPGDTIYSDSMLVVNQLNGRWRVKSDNIKFFWKEAKEIIKIKLKDNIKIKWIPREKNLAGIILEKVKY